MAFANRRVTLLAQTAIAAAVANQLGSALEGLEGCDFIGLQATFNYGAGGTTVKAWLQTSLDAGVTWFDIANFAFTTAAGKKLQVVRCDPATPLTPGTVPASAALADNTVVDGVIGDRARILYTTTGTYTGTTNLKIDAIIKSRGAGR